MSEVINVNVITQSGDIWQMDAFRTAEKKSCVRVVHPDWAKNLGLDDAVYCARHLEQGYEHPCSDVQLTITSAANSPDPITDSIHNRAAFALAAVLADLALRGRLCYKAKQHWLLGGYENWATSTLCRRGDYTRAFKQLEDSAEAADAIWIARHADGLPDMVSLRLRGQTKHVGHLGALLSGEQAVPETHTKRVYFPVVDTRSNIASLLWVEVSTRPVSGVSVDSIVSTNEHQYVMRKRDRTIPPILESLRTLDADSQAWNTRVRFSEENFSGASYELALVMAYRIARGYEPDWLGGRLIASGCSNNWALGKVNLVEGRKQKLDLLQSEVNAQDRVLLPAGWHNQAFGEAPYSYIDTLNRWPAAVE